MSVCLCKENLFVTFRFFRKWISLNFEEEEEKKVPKVTFIFNSMMMLFFIHSHQLCLSLLLKKLLLFSLSLDFFFTFGFCIFLPENTGMHPQKKVKHTHQKDFFLSINNLSYEKQQFLSRFWFGFGLVVSYKFTVVVFLFFFFVSLINWWTL